MNKTFYAMSVAGPSSRLKEKKSFFVTILKYLPFWDPYLPRAVWWRRSGPGPNETTDHDASRASEVARVRALGATVAEGRLHHPNGSSTMPTRGMGDYEYKVGQFSFFFTCALENLFSFLFFPPYSTPPDS